MRNTHLPVLRCTVILRAMVHGWDLFVLLLLLLSEDYQVPITSVVTSLTVLYTSVVTSTVVALCMEDKLARKTDVLGWASI